MTETIALVIVAWLVVGLAFGLIIGKMIHFGSGPDDE